MAEKKVTTAWDKHENRLNPSLRQLLRPSLISMAICGCYSYDANYVKTGIGTRARLGYRIFGVAYRIFCLLASLAAVVKSCAAFAFLPSASMTFNGITLAWCMQCFSIFLISFKSTHAKYGGLTQLFDNWDDKIRSEMESLGIEFPETKLLKRQKMYLCIAAILCIFNVSGLALLAADILSDGFGMFFAAPFSKSVSVLIVSVCLLAVITMLWILPLFYIILLSTLLTSTFEAFNQYLENQISQKCFTITRQFQKIRLLHLNLSKMVSDLDKDFGYYFATIFVFSIGLSCFILYQIIRNPMNGLTLVMFLFWLMSELSLLGAVSVFAAFVNEAVSI